MSSIWKYQAYLPKVDHEHRVSLGEGQTPLVRSKSIAFQLGLENLYFKLEHLNPTGSYKDRFAAVVVGRLVSRSQRLCIATSSGNTGAALAAYCAAAGIRCFVATVETAPLPKIRQMQVYGAVISTIKGFGIEPGITTGVFKTLEDFVGQRSLPLPISAYCYCAEGMSGVQTIAYEILDDMEEGVDHIFVPAGGGGLCLAIAKGVMDYLNDGIVTQAPKVHCVQPFGNNTIAGPLRELGNLAQTVDHATTAISGLQVPSVLDGDAVISHCRHLQGNGFLVEDEAVFMWQRELALREGIFCEPAGAAALAGLASALQKNEVNRHDKIVCLITGSGFKDMAAVAENFQLPAIKTIENAGLLMNELTSI